jgi:hypothetical protein
MKITNISTDLTKKSATITFSDVSADELQPFMAKGVELCCEVSVKSTFYCHECGRDHLLIDRTEDKNFNTCCKTCADHTNLDLKYCRECRTYQPGDTFTEKDRWSKQCAQCAIKAQEKVATETAT